MNMSCISSSLTEILKLEMTAAFFLLQFSKVIQSFFYMLYLFRAWVILTLPNFLHFIEFCNVYHPSSSLCYHPFIQACKIVNLLFPLCAFNMFCECQVIQACFPHYLPKYFNCLLHALSMAFSVSFCRITFSLFFEFFGEETFSVIFFLCAYYQNVCLKTVFLWFGLVSLFNSISTPHRSFNAKILL